MLRLVLPKGSLEKATLELFAAADLPVVRSSSVDYRATIDDPRIAAVRILRPQEIPMYVAEGLFDLGLTGRDWVEETASDVISLGELRYSKATSNPVLVVAAVAADSPVQRVEDLPQGVRVTSEYPKLTERYFASKGIAADVRLSYGATEAKIPDIADCVVEITETGRALRAAGLRIIDTVLVSYTEMVALGEISDGQRVGQRWVRHRIRRREAHHQHPDPRSQRCGCVRHLGAADQQDRRLTCAAPSPCSTARWASARSLRSMEASSHSTAS